MNNYYGGIYPSDIGDIGVMTHKGNLLYVELFIHNALTFHSYDTYSNLREDSLSKKVTKHISLYLAGISTKKDKIDGDVVHGIRLAPRGSDFQKLVWNALLQIPYATTKSYKDIAIMLNKPSASRAVGNACAKNPILFFIPCHRVIGSDGKVGGYRARRDIKSYLISLEKDSIGLK